MNSDIKIEAIQNLISDHLASGKDMLVSTRRLLDEILEIASEETIDIEEPMLNSYEQKIIISCDASIKKNPGGPAAVGVVVRSPDPSIYPTKFHRCTNAQTNNEAEYDAIYEGLMFLANIVNRPKYPVVIRSDSQLIVKQLTGEYQINNEILKRKCQSINDLAKALPVPIEIEWHARNSTPDLTEANFLAQDALGVRRH
jgi:ribonuclease HI